MCTHWLYIDSHIVINTRHNLHSSTMDKFVKKTIIPARPRQHTVEPTYQQIRISDMKKVTKLDDVYTYKEQLQTALRECDWQHCIGILELLNDIHVSSDVLQSTKIGVVVGKCRKISYLQSFASNASNTNAAGSTDDDEVQIVRSNDNTPTSSNDKQLQRIAELCSELVNKWKRVYASETERIQRAAASIDFAAYSSNASRVKSFKALYKQCDSTYTDISKSTHPNEHASSYIATTIESYLYKQCLAQTNSSSNKNKHTVEAPINSLSPITSSLYSQMVRSAVQSLAQSIADIAEWKRVYNQVHSSTASMADKTNILNTQLQPVIHDWIKQQSIMSLSAVKMYK